MAGPNGNGDLATPRFGEWVNYPAQLFHGDSVNQPATSSVPAGNRAALSLGTVAPTCFPSGYRDMCLSSPHFYQRKNGERLLSNPFVIL